MIGKTKNYWHNYLLETDPRKIEDILEERIIISGGKKIHLDLYNLQQKVPTVIFIHGTSAYGRFYSEFLYFLFQNNFRVVSVDLQGHGWSSGNRGHFTIDELVNTISDVATYVINTFGSRLAVMGSSLGGILSLYVIAKDNRFQTAICHNIAVFSESQSRELLALSHFQKILFSFIPLFAKLLPHFRVSVLSYLDLDRLASTPKSKKILDIYLKDPLISIKYSLKALYSQTTSPLAKNLEEIDTPILILHGEKDKLFSLPFISKIFQRLTCNKKMEIIQGVGHLIFQEVPRESAKIVVEWLSSVFNEKYL